mgnify:CR=1 FL=1
MTELARRWPVSVVIPVLNEEENVERAVEHVSAVAETLDQVRGCEDLDTGTAGEGPPGHRGELHHGWQWLPVGSDAHHANEISL